MVVLYIGSGILITSFHFCRKDLIINIVVNCCHKYFIMMNECSILCLFLSFPHAAVCLWDIYVYCYDLYLAATGNPTRIPETVQDIIFGHELFWNYPQLLPGVGFGRQEHMNCLC